jgi:hypothetical protein
MYYETLTAFMAAEFPDTEISAGVEAAWERGGQSAVRELMSDHGCREEKRVIHASRMSPDEIRESIRENLCYRCGEIATWFPAKACSSCFKEFKAARPILPDSKRSPFQVWTDGLRKASGKLKEMGAFIDSEKMRALEEGKPVITGTQTGRITTSTSNIEERHGAQAHNEPQPQNLTAGIDSVLQKRVLEELRNRARGIAQSRATQEEEATGMVYVDPENLFPASYRQAWKEMWKKLDG